VGTARQHCSRTIVVASCVLALAAVAAGPEARAQADFTGVWQAFAAATPDNADPPWQLTEAGSARIDAAIAQHGDNYVEPGIFCVPPGMPSTMTAMVSYPIEIIHSEGRITMLAELDMQIRRVFIDGRGFPDDHPATRMGYSIGYWDGATLVIETRLLSEYLIGSWPRTENTEVRERIYRTTRAASPPALGYVQPNDSDQILAFELTVSDSQLYDGPQQITVYYQRIPDDSFLEYDCPAELWYRALDGETW
jgi:hypothetical protein